MNHFPTQSTLQDACTQSLSPQENVSKEERSWWANFCRQRLLGRLKRFQRGQLHLIDNEETIIGASVPTARDSVQLRSSVFVQHPDFYSRTLMGGTIGAAESYIRGEWTTDDLTDLIRMFIRNMPEVSKWEKSWARVRGLSHWMKHLSRKNTKAGSRKNIHEHYDLGNDFYSLFLDPTMNYSSGIFPTPESSMHEASLNKMNWICTKLKLDAADHVLEIGTGWGGLAIHMARTTGCKVTTTTISKEQFNWAVQAVKDAGLEDRIEILLSDYRDLKGQFDKIVSIEMIEAVGHQFYDQYFEQCSNLLTDDGLMLIQGIMMSEQNYQHHINNIDFIRRYVFPGGCLPSIGALGHSISRVTDMRMVHLDDITEHYVTTLVDWREKFFDQLEEVRTLGFDESFIRLWDFYLCYCEAAFAERRVLNTQLVLAKPGSDVDPAVDYRHLSATAPTSRVRTSKNQERDLDEHCPSEIMS